MSTDKDPLEPFLASWRDVEPAPGFEERVWRRIAATAPAAQPGIVSWLLEWFRAEPAWVPAVSAIAGVVAAVLLSFPSAQPRAAHLGVLSPDSLSGSYVRLVAGAQP